MSDKRAKKSKREDIPAAAVSRLLKSGVSGTIRVSSPAIQSALGLVNAYVSKAGKEAAKVSGASKMSTIKDRHAEVALLNPCVGVDEANLKFVDHKTRGLPVAGVARVFRGANNLRVSAVVEKMATAAAEAYLETLGRRAAMITMAAKRQTISEADIKAAAAF